MKTRFTLVLILSIVAVCLLAVFSSAEDVRELHYDRFFLTLPEMDLRADPSTPGKVDTIYAGQEVEILDVDGIYAYFTYVKDGEAKTGATWIGAISPAVRIHLLKDEYIFRKPYYDLEDYGIIAAWREPTDDDLLILWEETIEGAKWYYVCVLPDCRCGYMRGVADFEVVK